MIRVLQDKRFFLLFLTALIFSLSKSAFATTYVTPTDDQLVIGSRAIVRGRVLAVESAFDRQTGRVWTYTTLRINEVLKGDITQRKITIKEEGGQTAERGSIVYGTPQFKLNEQVILYLDSWGDGSLRVHDMFLGKFTISTDAQSGLQYAQRSLTDVNVVNVQSLGANISAESTEKMELSAYLQLVRNKVAANTEQSRAYEEAYYSLVPKLAEPPEFRNLRQQGRVEPQWTYISGAHPRWFEPDDNQPVVFMVNPAGAPNQQIMNDISAAMNAWSTVPGCGLRVTNGGSTTDCGPTDTSNNIVFNNCDGRWSGGPCQSILALGGLSWFPGQTRVINGVTFVRASAGFISFNPLAACNFGNSCNVQEITTHELGHALGLGHSADTTATMYGIAHFDGRCASTRQDDRDGITFIYPGTGGGGALSITTASLPNGTIGAAYTQTLLATGGTLPYTWTLVSGALPAGLTLNSNGTISGTPSSATTANFTVQVRDTAQATAQRAFTITVATAAAQYDSQFISQSVPTSVQPGQQFTVNVKFLNTGTQPWATGQTFNFYLASQNPALNQTWGGNGIALFDFPTSPGQQLDLTFGVTAPTTAGTYNFQWQLYQNGGIGFFGQMSQNVVIQVGSGGGTPTNNAIFDSQSVPTSMTAGQTYNVSITMENNGTTTWLPSTYKLGSQNPQDNTTWGINRATLQNSVAPNGTATFTFNVTAPTTPGTYNFQWRMLQEGVGYFGTASTNVPIIVGTNGATFVSQNIPNVMAAGQTYPVTIQVRNTGTSIWTTDSYKLGSQNPQDNTTWGTSRVSLTSAVAPNGTALFNFNVTAPTTPGSYNFQWQMIQEGVGFFGALTTNVAITVNGGTCTVPVPPPPSSLPNDTIWVEDQVPAGAFFAGVWVWDPTRKMSGAQSNTEPAQAGIHQHYFQNATQVLSVGQTDKLVCYVMLNPCDTPQELMLQWRDASGWEHRAYWGQNIIPWGTDGTQSRYNMGALPSSGQWVRLEVPATLVGMNGRVADGMAFTLYGGQAWFDRTGKDGTTGGGGCTVAVAPPASNLPNDVIWVDDQLPSGAIAEGIWSWDTTQKTSGTQSNTEPTQGGIHQHYFYNGASLSIGQNDKLVCYVLLSTCDTPREVMLQWHDSNGWGHRAYWGQNAIPWGTDGTQSRYYMGVLPQAGQWTRLEVPASLVGLSGRAIDGMAFTLSDGQAWFDRAGKDNNTGGGGCTVSVAPPSNLPNDFIWVDDQVPAGAFFDGIWDWDTTQKMSGTRSNTEPVQSSVHQHYFQDATQRMTVGQNDMLVCYVLISPCDTPFELMLQWHDANGWEHRAYWGQNIIDWGVSGTPSRYYMGPMPQAGGWVRLEVPANGVGVNGRVVDGMAFTLYGGKAWFDRAGKTQ